MNLQILAADIVRRVQNSPDSAHNLAQVVAQLIREELNRGRLVKLADAMDDANKAIADMGRHRTED